MFLASLYLRSSIESIPSLASHSACGSPQIFLTFDFKLIEKLKQGCNEHDELFTPTLPPNPVYQPFC